MKTQEYRTPTNRELEVISELHREREVKKLLEGEFFLLKPFLRINKDTFYIGFLYGVMFGAKYGKFEKGSLKIKTELKKEASNNGKNNSQKHR